MQAIVVHLDKKYYQRSYLKLVFIKLYILILFCNIILLIFNFNLVPTYLLPQALLFITFLFSIK